VKENFHTFISNGRNKEKKSRGYFNQSQPMMLPNYSESAKSNLAFQTSDKFHYPLARWSLWNHHKPNSVAKSPSLTSIFCLNNKFSSCKTSTSTQIPDPLLMVVMQILNHLTEIKLGNKLEIFCNSSHSHSKQNHALFHSTPLTADTL